MWGRSMWWWLIRRRRIEAMRWWRVGGRHMGWWVLWACGVRVKGCSRSSVVRRVLLEGNSNEIGARGSHHWDVV